MFSAFFKNQIYRLNFMTIVIYFDYIYVENSFKTHIQYEVEFKVQLNYPVCDGVN